MNQRKGFIQIPLLIAIIAGALVVSGVSYFGVKKYQAAKVEKEKMAQETQQQKDSEVEKLKQEVDILKKQQTSEQKVQSNQQNSVSQNISISATDLKPYLDGIVQIDCQNTEGSGSLFSIDNVYYVLTNYHVVETPYSDGHCNIRFTDNASGKERGFYQVYPSVSKRWNVFTDVALLALNKQEVCDNSGLNCLKNIPIEDLNYKLSLLNKCSSKMSINAPIVTLGYPAFGKTSFSFQALEGEQSNLIASNGVVSGYDDSSKQPLGSLPYSNYFVSAKIDSGDSGGIALSKDKNGLCVLGIPTWLSIGNYETQGLVQNIHNVMYNP